MSSESTADSYMSSEDCTDLSIHDIFQHSAGLQTARSIVRSLLNATTTTSVDGDLSSTIFRFSDTDHLSSESAQILRDLLAFKDTEEAEDNTDTNSPRGPEQTSQAQHTSSNSTCLNQMVAGDNFNSPPTSLPTSEHGLPFKPYNVLPNTSAMGSSHPRLETDSPYRVESPFRPESCVNIPSSLAYALGSNQPRNGTDSPYRVESPFRIESDLNINVSSTSSKTLSPSFGNHIQDPHRYNIEYPIHTGAVLAAHSDRSNVAEKNSVHYMALSSCSSVRSGQKGPTSSAGRGIKDSTSIKSFLPVNKGIEHIVNNRKEQSGPTTNRRIMPNPLAPLSNLAPKISTICDDQNDPSQSSPTEVAIPAGKSKKRRNKLDSDGCTEKKRRKITEKTAEKGEKTKRLSKPKLPKAKVPKPEPARFRIGLDVWLRILEFTPPAFLRKARLINKDFNELVGTYQSLYLNQRVQNFGEDMPGPSINITEKKYNDLLSGRGCMEPGCNDSKASRTHWSWELRLCQNCWKSKIEREDRLQKIWQGQLTRTGINKLLECIPVAMHDSFMKPHDYIEDLDARPRGAPRLYRYHFKSDVEKIVREHEVLKPPPFQENPEHSTAEKASALAAYQALEADLLSKRNEFLESRKTKNDEHMKRVVKIETCIRNRRSEVAKPYDANRAARKERFTKGAIADLPDIPLDFVKRTKAYKAAVRIFRDPGTERGWQLLKPKIQDEWDKSDKNVPERLVIDGSNTTTRENSVATDTERASYPIMNLRDESVSYPTSYLRNDSTRHVSAQTLNHRQSVLSQMNPWERRASLMPHVNENDPAQSSFFSGMNQVQGFQHNVAPISYMRPTISYHQSLQSGDLGMAGSSLQSSTNYVSYRSLSNFALGQSNTSGHGSNMQITDMSRQGQGSNGQFQGSNNQFQVTNNQLQGPNGQAQGSMKQMAIPSLLNNSYSAGSHGYTHPWN